MSKFEKIQPVSADTTGGKLTPKRQAFARAVASGMTQADAYRTHYNVARMSEKTVREEASRLMASPKVSAMVSDLQAELAAKNLWTREQSVEVLAALARNEGCADRDRITAIKELNQMHGFREPTRLDLLNSDGSMTPVRSREEIEAAIERKLEAAYDSADWGEPHKT